MSIRSEITRINNNIAAAYSAAESKGATMPVTENSANLADTIDSIRTGGGDTGAKPIKFYDYDGTVLYAYSAAEALALSSLPALPAHRGLIAQKWNRSLSSIKASAQAGKAADIGCGYDTDDGSTKLYIKAVANTSLPAVTLRLRLSPQSTITIEWGDGTSDTLSNTDILWQNKTANHNYTEVGIDTELCISLSGDDFELNHNGGSYSVFNNKSLPLARINIGSSCSAINNYAFYGYNSLTSITIPDSVTSIGQGAFQNCSSLTSITIPDSVTSIGQGAFNYCSSLTSITIPDSVTSIGQGAFQNCSSLTSITIPDSVTSIGQSAFNYCSSLTSITIPDSVTSIGQSAFQNCYSLTSITIPDSVTSIGQQAFQDCKNLFSITIPDTITAIPDYLCSGCSNMYRVQIPNSVVSISNMAFYSSSNLHYVDLSEFTDPTTIPTLASSNVFYNMPGKFIVANAEMMTAFRAATNWSSFASTKWEVKS